MHAHDSSSPATGRAKRVRFELPRQAMPVIPLKGFLREAGLSGYRGLFARVGRRKSCLHGVEK